MAPDPKKRDWQDQLANGVDKVIWFAGKVIWFALLIGGALLLRACDERLGLCHTGWYPFC